MMQLFQGLYIQLTLVFLMGLVFGQKSEAQFIKCSGDLDFWYEEQTSRRKFIRKLSSGNPNKIFGSALSLKNRFAVGSIWSKPDVVIQPFHGISADIRPDKQALYKFTSDGHSWLILIKGRQKLECDVAETHFF